MISDVIEIRQRAKHLMDELHGLTLNECHTRLQLHLKHVDYVLDEYIAKEQEQIDQWKQIKELIEG